MRFPENSVFRKLNEVAEIVTFEALRLLWTVAYLAWKVSARLELSLVCSCPSGCCSHQSSKSRGDISERTTFVRSAFAATKTERVIKARTDQPLRRCPSSIRLSNAWAQLTRHSIPAIAERPGASNSAPY